MLLSSTPPVRCRQDRLLWDVADFRANPEAFARRAVKDLGASEPALALKARSITTRCVLCAMRPLPPPPATPDNKHGAKP